MSQITFPILIVETPHQGNATAYVVRDSSDLHKCLPENGNHDILTRETIEHLAREDAEGWAADLELAATLTGEQVMYRASDSREYEFAASADHAALAILGHDLSSLQTFTAENDPVAVAAALREYSESPAESAKLLADLGHGVADVARVLHADHGCDLTAAKVAEALYADHGLDLSTAEVAEVLADGLDLDANDVAWALYASDGLNLEAAEVAAALAEGLGLDAAEVANALRGAGIEIEEGAE